MNANHYKKNFGSTVLTLVVIFLLLVSGPAGAINTNIDGLKGYYNKDKQIQFTVDTDINHGDDTKGELLTNLQYTEVTFTNGEWSKACKVYLNNTVTGCDFLYVKEIKVTGENNYGYGYGYGYDDDVKYDLGYGYGYGYNDKNTHIKYKLVVNSSLLDAGKYTATTTVYTSAHTFESEDDTKFTIFKAKGKEHKKENHNDEDEDDEDEEFDDDAGFDVELNRIGNITVDEYGSDHPLSKLDNPSNKRLLGKYLDISTDTDFTDATIKIYYNGKGKNLGIYYFNETSEEWQFVGNLTGKDKKRGTFIYANVNHFSIYALFGNEDAPKTETINTGGANWIMPKTTNIDAPKTTIVQPKVTLTTPVTEEKEEPVIVKEVPKTVKSEKTAPTGRFLTATNASMAAAIFVLLSGGLILRKKGVI